MNSKSISKELKKLGYTLRRTSDVEARWTVVSDTLTYHWNFKTLTAVQRFMVDERSMHRYAMEHAAFRS